MKLQIHPGVVPLYSAISQLRRVLRESSRSADSHVRVLLAHIPGFADKAVRAPLLATLPRCALLVVSLLATPLHAAESSSGSQSLFNGKDLVGWEVPDPNPFWKVESGVLVGENDESLKGNVLHTEKSYKDFVLELEVRWSGEIDGGVMLRKPELQVQFGVSRSLKTDMTGSFYTGGTAKYPEAGQAKEISKVFKPGDWNTVKIEAKGDTFSAWFNGTQVSQYTDAKFAEAAPIGLQVHPGLKMKVEFRNIRVQAFD